jgi:predicted nucleotidyltransferase
MVWETHPTATTPGDAAVDRQAILDRLHAEAPALRERYGVSSLAVFGSMARGDDREDSDVDILVTFDGKPTFRGYMGLKLDLEDLLGRPVDLATPDTLRPEIRPGVERDLIHVP